MKRMIIAFLGVAVGSVLVLTVVSRGGDAPAQKPDEGAWGAPANGLCCSIRASKAAYAPGEDILLDVFLRNDGVVPAKVMRPLVHFSFIGDALPLQVSGPNGLCFYNGPFLEPPPPPGASAWLDLPAKEITGTSSTYNGPLRIIQKYWSMSPGDYTIRLKFERKDNDYSEGGQKQTMAGAWAGEAMSNAITVRIAGQ